MSFSQTYKLIEILGEERQATRENVERKQARTSDELEEDEDADAAANDESDDEEEQILYNPKNLPLGTFILYLFFIFTSAKFIPQIDLEVLSKIEFIASSD